MKRLIVVLSALLFATAAWAICTPILQIVGGEEAGAPGGCSGTIGTTTYTAGMQTPSTSTICYVKPITATCSDTSGEFCARLDDVDTSTHYVYMAIYDDDAGDDGGTAGEPWTRLDYTQVGDTISDPTNHCEAFTATITDTETYYVGYCIEMTGTQYGAEATSGASGERYFNHSSSTPPAEWPHATDSTSTYNRTIYLNFP
jgi:hypothetical protein